MSVVTVKVTDEFIDVAADSILVYEDTKRTDSNFNKLIQIGEIIIGSTGSAQEASLFMKFCEEHETPKATEKGVLDFLCDFKTWQSKYLEPSNIENEYIIVIKDKAFVTTGLFVEEVKNYAAIGAGQDFALAALYLDHSAKEAVKVACDLSCYVSEPIIEFSIKK